MKGQKPDDSELGMDRPITRRDFLHGTGAFVAGTIAGALPRSGSSAEPKPADPADYPPARSGLRGSQTGSYEVAHQLALDGRRSWGPVGEPDGASYDLVVVGGGVSGLAAAYFFRRQKPDARILILDNHDDFGGHARRNEFRSGERTLIGYGGSQSLEDPGGYSPLTKRLLAELGVETSRFYEAFDGRFYLRHGLGMGVYFDRASWGVDRLVPFELIWPRSIYPAENPAFAAPRLPPEQAVARMPISPAAKWDLQRLYDVEPDRFEGDPTIIGERSFLRKINYKDFLVEHHGIRNPEVWKIFDAASAGSTARGIDAVDAWDIMSYMGFPGLPKELLLKLYAWDYGDDAEPYIFHFPDGNASIARLLVRRLIPGVAPGDSMEDVVRARFDYARLDESGSPVRLRLESTVIRVEHDGPPSSAKRVGVTYVRGGRAQRVWGKACVLACYNMMIPYLCPELPGEQREALSLLVKSPLVYTNVLLRNWRPWKAAGLAEAYCPGSYHQTAMLDYPVNLGGVRFSASPDEPMLAHLEHAPIQPHQGLTPREQFRAGRSQLLRESFEAIERATRTQLAGMLGHVGFDPARDIDGLTVNRWPHGYAYSYAGHGDPEYAEDAYPHLRGRQPFGRIAIANSDSGARALIDCAIDQAYRAVGELSS